jgi:hypothetical protein
LIIPLIGQNLLRVLEYNTSMVSVTVCPMFLHLAYLLPSLIRIDFSEVILVLVLRLGVIVVGVISNRKSQTY